MSNLKKSKGKSVLFSGDEALAQGAYEAGLTFAAGYPGTPSTEILQFLAQFHEIDSQWSVNEKVAFEVAYAAAIGGKRSLYVSKHVGVNVAMDGVMTSAYMGVNAGFVIVTCDDPGLHSSQNEQDNRLFARVAKMPLLEPASPSEAKAMIQEAFKISERFDTPVIVRMTTRVCHSKENIVLGTRKSVPVKDFTINPKKYVMVPRNAYFRHIDLEKRLVKLKAFAEQTAFNKMEINDKKLGFITAGVSHLYAKELYPEASFLKLGMEYPFPGEKVKAFCRQVKKVVVLEELEPFLENQCQRLGLKVRGKDPSFCVGELRPEYLADIVSGRPKKEKQTVSRPPALCLGCPHRLIFSTLKKSGAIVAGDIGCYTLGSLPPYESVHTCLCMGSGVTFQEGLSKSIQGRKVVGVIGDSTFVHSGITGIINAVYNKTRGVVIIMDNATTAMTGGQPHPGTGVTLKGETTKKLVLEDLVAACGVDHVDVVDPVKYKEFENLLTQRLNEDGFSVIIARRPCLLKVKTS